eukprot:GEZU01000143.1.p2 GENE.GEZU01000143.1~~GEZU01000143.1.p2  ORF type:complete len:132 (+),score=22.59 GEZU01000143.1:64-459(+)
MTNGSFYINIDHILESNCTIQKLIANRDATLEGAESFTIRTILGNRESIAEHLIARQIIERIAPHTERPVLFCIGLAKPVLDDFNRNTAFAKEGDGTDEDNRDDFHNNNEEHKRRDFLRKICQVVETCRVW